MLMCNRVMLNKAGAVNTRPAAVAIVPQRAVAAFLIKSLNAALVWTACGQSERK